MREFGGFVMLVGFVVMLLGTAMFGMELVRVVQSAVETGRTGDFPPNMFKWFGLGIIGGVLYELGKITRG
ncbi:hypothetical protein GKJPGBOP_07957 [Streptomyces paromomycinus]|uniref:Uncharacterized protein n=2 Tax=Streptomyces paromomycinus TaxID=92743 RepID=A0A401WFR9_STREY|nr:hypothetical protein GKJPGBOP_07957 [Streptomyces paromomycinus]